MASSTSDNLKIRRISESLFSLYDGLLRIPNAMPGLEGFLAEIAAFPDGRHDDQVDAFNDVAAYRAKVIYEALRWGSQAGAVVKPPAAKVDIVPPKSHYSTSGGAGVWADARSAKRRFGRIRLTIREVVF